jgi:hypothetical protein
MYVLVQDGREISVPLWWYPRLQRATPEQRRNWEILPFGDALHWPDLDEDLDVHGFLIGAKAPSAAPPHASQHKVAITSVRVTAGAMRRLDNSEFQAVCVLGSALNDLGLLKRAMWASGRFPESTSVERNIGCSQLLFFARLHLSKIHETLVVIDQVWRSLAVRYEPMLSKDAQKAVKYLMKYKNSGKSLANVVRNEFEFHFPVRHLRNAGFLEDFAESDIFTMYIHQTRLNSFYFGSNMMLINYLLRELGYTADQDGLNQLVERITEESLELDSKVHVFAEDLLSKIFVRMSQELEPVECDTVSFDANHGGTLDLPFFIDAGSIKAE